MDQHDDHEVSPPVKIELYHAPSYPTPLMQPSYSYQPLHSQQAVDVYQKASTHNNGSYNLSLELPPIRSVERAYPPSLYESNENIYSLPPGMGLYRQPEDSFFSAHYPASIAEGQVSVRVREKREIKRRTKTGCVTCRRRRIKCDETHPDCRNCLKSKRQCGGYDPIFKPQGAPQEIQSTPSETPEVESSAAAQLCTSTTYSGVDNSQTSTKSRPSSICASTIDPALSGTMEDAPVKTESILEDQKSNSPSVPGGQDVKAHPVIKSISDLWMTGKKDPPTPKTTQTITNKMMSEMRLIYMKEYASGIDQILETSWYTERGWDFVVADTKLCEMFAGVLDLYRSTAAKDYEAMRTLPLVESRLLWSFLCLPRSKLLDVRITPEQGWVRREDKPTEVRMRLDVIEHLLTGQQLGANPFTHDDAAFWYQLGQFVSSAPEDEMNDTLLCLRGVLEGRENRDVLYSMVIVRHFGKKAGVPPVTLNAVGDRDRAKLAVAKRFIEDEAAGKGMTQVVQRLCGMAIRSWTDLW